MDISKLSRTRWTTEFVRLDPSMFVVVRRMIAIAVVIRIDARRPVSQSNAYRSVVSELMAVVYNKTFLPTFLCQPGSFTGELCSRWL